MAIRTHFIFFFFCFCLCLLFIHNNLVILAQQNNSKSTLTSFDVGVVLDFDSLLGKIGLSCITMARDDFYTVHKNYKTRLKLYPRDSKRDIVGAASAALDLLRNVEVDAIIGPQNSSYANFLMDLGEKAQVPIISFSATSPSLSFRTPYFVRTAQNDSSQIQAITAVIQTFKWREIVLVYEDTEYGKGSIPFLIDALQEIEVRVTYRNAISISATDSVILEALHKMKNMYNRVFIVHMSHSLGSRFFLKAKEAEMMSEGFVWIMANGLMNFLDFMDFDVIRAMQGVLGVRPYIPRSKELDDFTIRWRRRFSHENPTLGRSVELNVFGLWAYDTVWALARAAEGVGTTSPVIKNSLMMNDSTDITAIGTSQTGPKLLKSILEMSSFKGISGDFHLVNGQLQSSIFEILNVIGKGERSVGFWSPSYGISRGLNFVSKKTYTTPRKDLLGIIWPGESTTVPRGWVVIPITSGKKLKIAVPKKAGFNNLINVIWEPDTNKTNVTGYCVDVFNAVIEALPYGVPYEFVPVPIGTGSGAMSYNDLVYQIYLQKYDGIVGDTTITANRSLYADFSLPYTEGGLWMIVPIEYEENKSAWIFLKPLTKELWLTSLAFFILTGIVIWVLEHRINEAFRGPPTQHVGMILWFPFSTMVFAQRERVVSNLSRFVVIIWVFVVLILNSSYTASLSSMLTVEKLHPSVTTIQELIRNGDYVGYQQGSFVANLLTRLNFDESKLKPYNCTEECDKALSKGSKNGGISAFFDVTPYVKLLTAKYCDKYTMVGPINKTEGFGFVFPRGSPLVSDISRAILKITEDGEITRFDQTWFKPQTSCSSESSSSKDVKGSLNLSSFRGLFIITGTVSCFALTVSLAIFFYEHRHVLTTREHNNNRFWMKLKTIFKRFDEKDLSSYRFKRAEAIGRIHPSMKVLDVEASSSFSSSPFTYTGGNPSPIREMISIDLGDSISNSPIISEEMVDVRLQ